MNNNLLLAIDIGNTDITFGLFDGEELKKTFRIKSDAEFFLDNYREVFVENLRSFNVKNAILSSVNENMNDKIILALKSFDIFPMILSPKMCSDMKILTDNPSATGLDRLANAYAVRGLTSSPAIVVDIGTAITFDIVSKEGDFIGGLILPGINMQLESLHNKTNKLPEVSIKNIKLVIGKNTEDAILSGVINGIASAIDGLISKCKDELGESPSLYATGGQCQLISSYMSHKFDLADRNLTLKGLNKIARSCMLVES